MLAASPSDLTFTAHNIELPNGERTMPEDDLLLEERPLSKAVMRTLDLVFPPHSREGSTIIDVGCLEGGYALAFAKAGFTSLGIDPRSINVAKCEKVAEAFSLPNLRFVKDDARNIEAYGPVDAVFCCGLLYHLDEPAAFLQAVGRCTRRLLILQTHYASEQLPLDGWLRSRLSPLTYHEGNLGRWYEEFSEETSPEEMERHVWASFGNHRSFWIEKKHLLQAILDAGFDSVYEQFDYLQGITTDPYIEVMGRGTFVALKTGS
jgi:SAM-dependent methyltransferase